jgi:hypothetical protein
MKFYHAYFWLLNPTQVKIFSNIVEKVCLNFFRIGVVGCGLEAFYRIRTTTSFFRGSLNQ